MTTPPRIAHSSASRTVALVVLALLGLAVALGFAVESSGELTEGDAVVLGIVEGVTEFLPVSSTGHLTVTERLLDIGDTPDEKEAADAYAIVIQAGAILAVLGLYWSRVRVMIDGVIGRSAEGRRLVLALLTAFVPAAAIGAGLDDVIKDRLFGVGPIVAAWAVGGVAILVLAPRLQGRGVELTDLTVRSALVIGLAQSLALWPGTSRSLVTILAGLAVGLTLSSAVEMSFLLGLVTLSAATAYEGLKSGDVLLDQFGAAPLVIGLVASLLSAVVAVRWMVDYLNRRGLEVFGWYRIAVAIVVGALLLADVV